MSVVDISPWLKDEKILILKLLDLPSISILCTLLSITIIMNEYI